MPSTTLYYVFWLPTGLHYEANAAGDTNYENLLIQWAQDLGGTQFHNLVTQYNGNNGTISNTVSYGGSWTDTGAYPHAGTTGDPLQDSDIRDEITAAFAANSSWVQGINTIVAVFTANGIQECASFGCTFDTTGGFCATTTTSTPVAVTRRTPSWHTTTSRTSPASRASRARRAATRIPIGATTRTATVPPTRR